MTRPAPPAPYSLRQLEQMLGLGRRTIAALIGAGFVTPQRGPRNAYRFTFQDVVLLRTAHALQAARIPPRRVLRALAKLRAELPAELPLSGLRIGAVGNEVVVRDGDAQWQAESGQWVFDFDVAPAAGSVSILPHGGTGAPRAPPAPPATRTPPGPPAGASAADCFARGEQLESADPDAAEAAYRAALALAPDHVDAALNLGALLCDVGRCAEAVALYDDAVQRRPDAAALHFNRAIALEDLQRHREALQSYQRCLALAPDLADAHYNAARLHEKFGEVQRALRHYSAYRRLQS